LARERAKNKIAEKEKRQSIVCFTSFRESNAILFAYFIGEQAQGTITMFSCLTTNSRVCGGQPCTLFDASARKRSRSPPSLYAQT